jgi:TRAP-type C4-dicarboxylate transport system permease small subunit
MVEGGSEAREAAESKDRYAGPFGAIRRVDDLVFVVEEAIVVTSLIAMAVMVFLDVVYRRLDSQDSKVGAVLARIAGITDEGTRAVLDQTVAPVLGIGVGIGLIWFAFWTAERHEGDKLFEGRGGKAALTVITAAVVALFCWLMLTVPSKHIYILVYAVGVALWGVPKVRNKPDGWQTQVGIVALIVTPLYVWLALTYFPQGYTWSQELSLMLLLWIGFLGASVCAHEGRHLRMEAFDRILPEKAARIIHAVGYFGTAAFCAFMMLLGYRYVFDPETGMRAIGGLSAQTRIPDWISTLAVPVAFALTMLRFVAAGVSALMGGDYGKPPKDESVEAAERARAEDEESDSDSETDSDSDSDSDSGKRK